MLDCTLRLRRRAMICLFGGIGTLSLFAAPLTCSAAEPNAETLVESQPTVSHTLDSLIHWAERSNPRLRESAAGIQAARGKAYQAGLYPNPTLNGGGMQIGGRDSQYFSQLSQEIVTKHKLGLDQAAACQEVTQAELRFVRTRFELLTAVRKDYFSVLAAQRKVTVLRRLIQLSSDVAESGRKLQAAGEGTRGDTLLFEIELEKAEVSHENAIAELRAARRQLATDLALHDAPDLAVSGPLLQEPDGIIPFVNAAGFVPRNAEVQIAEREVNRSRFLLQRAEVQPFPNVTLSTGYIYQVMSPHNLAILQAEIPIPVWNKNQGNISAACAEVTKSQQAVARTQLDIARQMADAIGRYQQAQQQVVRYRERIIPRAQEGVKVARSGLESGQLDLLRLLQTQRALIDSSLSYLTSLQSRWSAAADIAGLIQLEDFPGTDAPIVPDEAEPADPPTAAAP
ncbi:Cobalt-zinc-cadmium resistance protein CzcC precursor [Caulifigura coniformis]|uniref:Cobalt-zinc-cadmium resistance protein CzcC n=1 Tax=Caulifigura coniformis TaxID=2527983 RepID=A0A517S9G6_9PLAN|nr:TolC family protein [Caulifigura coniformis]QDT52752.1 Cobalt-zinc-cadmium resistance protein CzcC precursor [Caulifigura coniformis]